MDSGVIKDTSVHLSIVIPVFNESKKIATDIKTAAAFLLHSKLKGEIIVVDDASTDNTLNAVKATTIPDGVALKICGKDSHRGKGCVVRTGILISQGDFVLFVDSGSCVPLKYINVGLNILYDGVCDIAHGSRKLRKSRILRQQTLSRKIISWGFRSLVMFTMGIPSKLTDTQCGFKMYNGEIARKLYKDCITNGFMFDIEIILRALQQGYEIKEFAIEWAFDLDSRLPKSFTLREMFVELREIKKALS